MKRRGFLKFLLFLLGSTAATSFAYPLLKFLAPPAGREKIKQLVMKKAEVPVGEGREVVIGNTPAIIINRYGKGYIALSKVCTHLGCIVEYSKSENKLICPCHAGTFNLEGSVVDGPPPKPLASFPLKVEGENLVIG